MERQDREMEELRKKVEMMKRRKEWEKEKAD